MPFKLLVSLDVGTEFHSQILHQGVWIATSLIVCILIAFGTTQFDFNWIFETNSIYDAWLSYNSLSTPQSQYTIANPGYITGIPEMLGVNSLVSIRFFSYLIWCLTGTYFIWNLGRLCGHKDYIMLIAPPILACLPNAVLDYRMLSFMLLILAASCFLRYHKSSWPGTWSFMCGTFLFLAPLCYRPLIVISLISIPYILLVTKLKAHRSHFLLGSSFALIITFGLVLRESILAKSFPLEVYSAFTGSSIRLFEDAYNRGIGPLLHLSCYLATAYIGGLLLLFTVRGLGRCFSDWKTPSLDIYFSVLLIFIFDLFFFFVIFAVDHLEYILPWWLAHKNVNPELGWLLIISIVLMPLSIDYLTKNIERELLEFPIALFLISAALLQLLEGDANPKLILWMGPLLFATNLIALHQFICEPKNNLGALSRISFTGSVALYFICMMYIFNRPALASIKLLNNTRLDHSSFFSDANLAPETKSFLTAFNQKYVEFNCKDKFFAAIDSTGIAYLFAQRASPFISSNVPFRIKELVNVIGKQNEACLVYRRLSQELNLPENESGILEELNINKFELENFYDNSIIGRDIAFLYFKKINPVEGTL